MIGWIFRGCALGLIALFALLVMILLGALGVISVPMKTLGIAFIIIAGLLVLVPIVIGVVIHFFLKKVAKALKEEVGSGMTSRTPMEIHLKALEPGTWTKSQAVMKAEDQFKELGFESVGEFSVDEMPQLKFLAYLQPAEYLWGIVYEHQVVGVWVDLVAKYDDGTSCTWSNSPKGGVLDPRPGHEKVNNKFSDAIGFYDMYTQNRGEKKIAPVTASDFVPFFENAYRNEMEWRAGRGGPTHEEIRRVAAASGREYPEEHMAMAEQRINANWNAELEEILRKKFIASNQITVSKWEQVRECVVMIHAQQTIEAALANFDLGDMTPAGPIGATSVLEAFSIANKSLPADQQFEFLGHVDEPTPCDFYAMPKDMPR